MKITVIGAGIGGLSAAHALAGDGHQVTLLERSADLAPVGAGIVLAPNAVQVLASFGISLVGEGQVLSATQIRRADGGPLTSLRTDRDGTTYGIARSRLHELLVQHLPTGVTVQLGAAVTTVEQTGTGVRVGWSAGRLDADLVVAADGLRSTVRAGLDTGPGTLRYSGTTCWRGFVDLDAGSVASETWGGRTRVGLVPVAAGTTYYYLVASAAPRTPGPRDLGELTRLFGGLGGRAGDVVASLDRLPPLHHDLWELERPVWGSGRVLLLGDAAHSMTPNQGQGAAMAIEDARALMLAVRAGADGALARYAAARHRRVRSVALDSRRIGEVAHWHHPAAVAVRDAVMRAAPSGLGDRHLHQLVRPGLDLAATR